jgi:hypothetical protein
LHIYIMAPSEYNEGNTLFDVYNATFM